LHEGHTSASLSKSDGGDGIIIIIIKELFKRIIRKELSMMMLMSFCLWGKWLKNYPSIYAPTQPYKKDSTVSILLI
jgi:hypothetical protein